VVTGFPGSKGLFRTNQYGVILPQIKIGPVNGYGGIDLRNELLYMAYKSTFLGTGVTPCDEFSFHLNKQRGNVQNN